MKDLQTTNDMTKKTKEMETKIRTLRAEEIECRVQSVMAKGCILLIYKDARVDMKILDEVYGNNNWQRTHEVINDNLFCNIDIWDNDKMSWVRKQDVGTESNTEKEKGQASDSFKRAGFNIGIGRELYTAPFTWVNLQPEEITEFSGKKQLAKGINFSVKEIEYNDQREIVKLVIVDQKGVVRFPNVKGESPKEKPEQPKTAPIPPTFDIAGTEELLKTYVTREEVQLYWDKKENKHLHTNQDYVALVTARLKAISNGTK